MRRAAAAAVAVLASAGLSVPAPAVVAGAAPGSGRAEPVSAGLEQSWTSADGTWAVVAMGHLHQQQNTFWQVLFRRAGAARWTLVTPPGAASNGGFSAGGAAGGASSRAVVTAGFQPTRKLRYSPIARTGDDGKTWTAGTLEGALVPAADAVAGTGAGSVLALVRSAGGTLVRSEGSLTKWKPVTDLHDLGSAAGHACGVAALTAVAVPATAGLPAELGTACAAPGEVGLFHESETGTWAATAVRLPARGRARYSARYAVLRLSSAPHGTTALVEATRHDDAFLVVLRRVGPAAPWTASSPVRLHGSVLSTASLGDTSLLVVTGVGFRAYDVLFDAGPGSGWRSLGAPPAGTQVVTSAPSATSTSAMSTAASVGPGSLDAVSVSGSEVTVWRRVAARWRRTSQRFRVPIEYGSST